MFTGSYKFFGLVRVCFFLLKERGRLQFISVENCTTIRNNLSVFSVGLAYGIIVTFRVSKSRKLLLFLIFLLAVLHLLLNNGLKEISVNCIKSLGKQSRWKKKA